MHRIIKRYNNRKLYDVAESRYIKLWDIGNYISQGLSIRVLNHDSEEDITVKILIQVLLKTAKKKQGSLSPVMLHQIIRYGSQAMEEKMNKVAGDLNTIYKEVDYLDDDYRDELKDLKIHIEKLEYFITELIHTN